MSPSSKVPLGVVRYNVSQSWALNSELLILVLPLSSKSSFRIRYILALPAELLILACSTPVRLSKAVRTAL